MHNCDLLVQELGKLCRLTPALAQPTAASSNRIVGSIYRKFDLLQKLVQYVREVLDVLSGEGRSSDLRSWRAGGVITMLG